MLAAPPEARPGAATLQRVRRGCSLQGRRRKRAAGGRRISQLQLLPLSITIQGAFRGRMARVGATRFSAFGETHLTTSGSGV
jgi:hypothetical protein